jgi:STE24 endopeptidase
MTVKSVDVRRGPYRRCGHFGAWRALAALPAMAGGGLVVLVLTAPFDAWQPPLLLLWLSGAAAFSTRVGERIALRAHGFRDPSALQWDVLGPVTSAALQRCGFQAPQVDWYVRAGSQPNACVAGRRSVAVTEGALSMFVTGGLSHDQFASILIHELGHHASRATHFGLATRWIAAPGRIAFRGVRAAALMIAGRSRLGWGSGVLLFTGGGVALARSVQHHHWSVALVLSGVAAATLATPWDAAISRAAERTADRFAIDLGAGENLARALLLISEPRPCQGWSPRLLDRHPSVASRVEALTRTPA